MFYNDPNIVDPYSGITGSFYNVGFYGTDETGYGWGGPINLNAYQNNPDTVVLYWSFKPYSSIIHSMTWEIQTDLVDTFDSPDLLTYHTHAAGVAAENFISGCVHKGLPVAIYPREQGAAKRMYWRVKGINGTDFSRWSQSAFDIPGAIDVAARTFTLSFLPDALYNKLPESNIYKLHDADAKEFEELNKEITLVNNDLYTISVRDKSLDNNFGELLDIIKPYDMKVIDYREIIKNFMANIRSAPSEKSVAALLHFVYGSYPEFVEIEGIATMYLEDPGLVEAFYSEDTDPLGPPVEAPILWDDRHIAYGVVLDIMNRFGAQCNDIITKQFVLSLVTKMSQAHAPVYLNYV